MITIIQLANGLGITTSRASVWINVLNDAMNEYEINTSLRIAHFVAQIGHESGRFVFMHELASGKAYDNREDLGNTKVEAIAIAKQHNTTTGQLYRGHGLIQITGYDNHKRCGEALGLDLVNNPHQLEIPKYAALSAAWFWGDHHLNHLADNDLLTRITAVINGGANGLADRRALLESTKKALGI